MKAANPGMRTQDLEYIYIYIYICSAILWQRDQEPVAHIYVSRCKEKSSPYSMTVFRDLLENQMNLKRCSKICWWSDDGRHVRSTGSISTMLLRGLQGLASRSELTGFNAQMTIAFGVPNHCKNVCDGCHSHIRSLLTDVAKK